MKLSVTNFLYCGDNFLFIERKDNLKVMPGQINGVGGKVESGEDYLTACIRETKEETRISVNKSKVKFCGIIRFENDNDDDWVTCFFKIKIGREILNQVQNDNKEGELIWIKKDEVLKTKNIAEDINYIWQDILDEKQFFLSAKVRDNNFKIYEI